VTIVVVTAVLIRSDDGANILQNTNAASTFVGRRHAEC
jgi:hypothetical protein